MIEIKNIKKSFGEKEVIKGVNAVFDKGKCNLIIGTSGSGKTVLMKCMVGLMKPTDGDVLYDGRDFIHISEEEKKGRALYAPPVAYAMGLESQFIP